MGLPILNYMVREFHDNGRENEGLVRSAMSYSGDFTLKLIVRAGSVYLRDVQALI